MDSLQWYEVQALLDSLEITCKQSWEQTRQIAYVVAQTQSTKPIKPSDLIKFSWDKKEDNKDTSITKEDVKRLTEKMNNIIAQNKK